MKLIVAGGRDYRFTEGDKKAVPVLVAGIHAPHSRMIGVGRGFVRYPTGRDRREGAPGTQNLTIPTQSSRI